MASSTPSKASLQRNPSQKPISKCCLCTISAFILSASLVLLIIYFSVIAKNKTLDKHAAAVIPEATIRLACNATQHPETCFSSLVQSNRVPPNPSPLQIILSAIYVSSQNLNTTTSMIKDLMVSSANNETISNIAKICLEVLGYSKYRIALCNDSIPNGDVKNARAWMSAALNYQTACNGGLKYHGGDSPVINKTASVLENLIEYTSNALSMMVSYDSFGNETASWRRPLTERDGFWEGAGVGSEMGFKGGLPSKLRENVTVCKEETSGCYRTVQEAVDAAPGNLGGDKRFVIRIKAGVYDEIVRIPLEKKNVVFLGDGMGRTIISGSLSAGQPGVNTYESATIGMFLTIF